MPLKKIAFQNCTQACLICRVWYRYLYTMMAKPLKTLELLYPVNQLLVTTVTVALFPCS